MDKVIKLDNYTVCAMAFKRSDSVNGVSIELMRPSFVEDGIRHPAESFYLRAEAVRVLYEELSQALLVDCQEHFAPKKDWPPKGPT